MTTNALTITADLRSFLIPTDADKHTRSRLALFYKWQSGRRAPWFDLDLKAYRDHLTNARGFAPATVSAHLSAVRTRYRDLMADNALRAAWLDHLGSELRRLGQDDSPANRKALLDEHYTRLSNALDPAVAPVKQITSQDHADSEHVRLTQAQAEALMHAPGTETLPALRDTCVISLLLCTGLREAELCALQIGDLRQTLGGKLSIHVRAGKGAKERLVPYGDLVWVLTVVDRWLARANIRSGAVLRSFWKGNEKLRGPLSVRAIEDIVKNYPVSGLDGRPIIARPHDLRRTYAKRQYETGLDLLSISQNLGHADTKTTLIYIGSLSADQRQAKLAYAFDLSRLK